MSINSLMKHNSTKAYYTPNCENFNGLENLRKLAQDIVEFKLEVDQFHSNSGQVSFVLINVSDEILTKCTANLQELSSTSTCLKHLSLISVYNIDLAVFH